MRDVLNVATDPNSVGRRLTATPWAVAIEVTHHRIEYGTMIAGIQDGYVLGLLKRAVFQATRDAITDLSEHG